MSEDSGWPTDSSPGPEPLFAKFRFYSGSGVDAKSAVKGIAVEARRYETGEDYEYRQL